MAGRRHRLRMPLRHARAAFHRFPPVIFAPMSSDRLDQLVSLSHQVGDPAWDCAILGEGNTSCQQDADTFWVKGSGCCLGTMGKADFVLLRQAQLVALLDRDAVAEAELSAAYAAAKADPAQPRRPSVEAVFHAMLLTQPGVTFVAHTHPTAVNMLSCTPRWREAFAGRLFPDEAVVCGPATCLVPYVDPGVPLARAIRDQVLAHRQAHGAPPKAIIMQNHGLIACGASATEAANITAMMVKAARIRIGALSIGGFADLGAETTRHLLARPDEKYRMSALTGIRP